MRRKLQAMTDEQVKEVLEKATAGVLCLQGDEEYPYGVPLTPTYDAAADTIYFHGAQVGHKVDCMKHNPKACFTIIDQDIVVPGALTTLFRSVIAFGTIRSITDEQEKIAILEAVGKQYAAGYEAHVAKAIEADLKGTHVFAFHIDSITGKESMNVLEARKKGRSMAEQAQHMIESIK